MGRALRAHNEMMPMSFIMITCCRAEIFSMKILKCMPNHKRMIVSPKVEGKVLYIVVYLSVVQKAKLSICSPK